MARGGTTEHSDLGTMVRAEAIEHSDLNAKVYDRLHEALLSGQLKADQRLAIKPLADQFGVSPSPIHQALTRLAAEGLVIVQSRRGYRVAPVSRQAVIDEYEVRLALELQAAEASIGRVTDVQLQAWAEALDETLAAISDSGHTDLPRYIASNQRFHRMQVDFAGNQAMSQIYERLRVNLVMQRLLGQLDVGPEASEVLHDEHLAIHAAFANANLRAAQRAIRTHVKTGERFAVEAIDAAGGYA